MSPQSRSTRFFVKVTVSTTALAILVSTGVSGQSTSPGLTPSEDRSAEKTERRVEDGRENPQNQIAQDARSVAERFHATRLSYSGRGTVFVSDGYLVFVPEGRDVERVMGFPVVFDGQGRVSEVDKNGNKVEISEVTGQIDARFDVDLGILTLGVQRDDGTSEQTQFDLFLATVPSGKAISHYLQSYFYYMATGVYPEDSTPLPDGTTASDELTLANSCNCTTDSCSASQTCGNSQECKCGCKGQHCYCYCAAL